MYVREDIKVYWQFKTLQNYKKMTLGLSDFSYSYFGDNFLGDWSLIDIKICFSNKT